MKERDDQVLLLQTKKDVNKDVEREKNGEAGSQSIGEVTSSKEFENNVAFDKEDYDRVNDPKKAKAASIPGIYISDLEMMYPFLPVSDPSTNVTWVALPNW